MLNKSRPGRQKGAVLITALVLLVVLTLLGTTAVQNTVMEERMAGNYYDLAVAFEAAESALRAGEGGLADDTTYSGYGFVGGDGTFEVTDTDESISPHDASNYALTAASDVVSDNVHAAPSYFIERLPEIKLPSSGLVLGFQDTTPTVQYYRVTARGEGISPNSEVLLQSTYLR